MSSEDDNTKSDEYWMGVRDALRMVDSFHKWSKRNPRRAKNLEDFIHDGLIAAAKRCESCLRDKMGLSFVEGEDEEDEITSEESLEHEEEEEEDDDDVKPESSIEEPISHVEPETFTPPPDDSDESSISMDRVERIEDESIDELAIEGPPREFSTDFDLVEPTPMFVDEEPEPEPIVPTEPEEVLSESTLEESETDQEPDSEEQPEKPSFSWSEYEEAVTPSSEPEPQDPEVDISTTSEDEEISTSMEEEELPEEPPEPPKVWSPNDEPSIPEDNDTEEETDTEIDETESLDEGDEPVITEPPLPPPPESEEDEEERKRRARRLFFGA